jgi:hypothetical protein
MARLTEAQWQDAATRRIRFLRQEIVRPINCASSMDRILRSMAIGEHDRLLAALAESLNISETPVAIAGRKALEAPNGL